MAETGKGARQDAAGQRKPLRVEVTEIDQQILRLLMRRHNLINKMKKSGRLDPAEEKFLREAWQNDVSRVSRDADLSGRFFALMQRVTFMPKPSDNEGESKKRVAFNLAPPNLPVALAMPAPLSSRASCAWIYMAAACGQALRLDNCLQNDSLVDCIRALVQMGGAITREDNAVVVRLFEPLGAPDKVLHTGPDEFNFYLFVAHYLGKHGHVKITGPKEFQLADYSVLRHILPDLGGRLVHIVPKSNGLPVRLETSGVLPAGITAPAEMPALFAETLLLAAPFYPSPFSLNISHHPQKQSILAHVLPILTACGAAFSLNGDTVAISPSELVIPLSPALPADLELASFMLALPAALGGEVKLEGKWPEEPEGGAVEALGGECGWSIDANSMRAGMNAPLQAFAPELSENTNLPEWAVPLIACLGACAVLHGGAARMPQIVVESVDAGDFFGMAGLALGCDGTLSIGEKSAGLAWNAPTPAWALAYAVAACARRGKPGWPLGNPGIITGLWPQFWSLYNSLPKPQFKKPEEQEAAAPPKPRRRIKTSAVAVLPEIKDGDWD